MAEIGERLIADAPGAGFAERHVDADGFRIGYLEAVCSTRRRQGGKRVTWRSAPSD
jgi:hypothetical protein